MSHSVRTLRSDSGFSFAEVMTVVTLIGIIGGYAVSNFREFTPAYSVRGAALEVAGNMSIARLSAVKESRIYQFVPLAGGYQIRAAKTGGGWDLLRTVTIANEFPHVEFGYSGIAKDPYGVTIAAAVPGAPMTFHSNGTVQNSGGVFIQAPMEAGMSHQAVTVTGAGRIRVWKHTGTKWQ